MNSKIIRSLLSYFLVVLISPFRIDATPTNPETTKVETKIIGGQPISIRDAPYQVSIRKKKSEKKYGFGYGHLCGGSVVSQRLIITAAHCTWDNNVEPAVQRTASDFVIVMGTHELYRANDNTLQYDVQQMIAHPNYNRTSYENDIAAMFVNGYIPWNWPTVSAIPLYQHSLKAGSSAMVSGWGITENNKESSQLLFTYVPIVGNDICAASYAREISMDMICAGKMNVGGADACQGDSGGPLTYNGKLVGVVSWGSVCGRPEFPGVYSNVSYNYDWVRKINGSFNYTHYGGGALGVRDNVAIVILSNLLMMLICYLMRLQ